MQGYHVHIVTSLRIVWYQEDRMLSRTSNDHLCGVSRASWQMFIIDVRGQRDSRNSDVVPVPLFLCQSLL